MTAGNVESWWNVPEPAPYFLVRGHFEDDKCVTMQVSRAADWIPHPSFNDAGPVLQLLSADGRVLAEGKAHDLDIFTCRIGDDDAGTADETADATEPEPPQRATSKIRGFDAAVPIIDGGTTLAIREGDSTLWMRRAPAVEPKILAFTCESNGSALELRWTDEVAHDEHYATQVSFKQALRGSSYQWNPAPVTRSIRRSAEGVVGERELTLDPEDFAPGSLVLTVRVSDGFHEVDSEPLTVAIPSRPPEVDMGGVMMADGLLMGAWLKPSRRDIVSDDVDYVWYVDGVEVDRGQRVMLPYPPPGAHELVVQATWQGHVVRRARPMGQRPVQSPSADA